MKKLLLLIACVAMVVGCSKDGGQEPMLDIKNLSELYGKDVAGVKAHIKGNLIREESTLGKVELGFGQDTDEGKFLTSCKFDNNGLCKDVSASQAVGSASSAINLTKKLSDRVMATYSSKSYGAFLILHTSYKTFTDRKACWDYVGENLSSIESVDETWGMTSQAEISAIYINGEPTGPMVNISISSKN